MKKNLENNFYEVLQENVAKYSINGSVLRNQGSPEIVKNCRDYCKNPEKLNLDLFFKSLRKLNYSSYLDNHTQNLINNSPVPIPFGSARKALNIFFRNVCYNTFFKDKYLEDVDLRIKNTIIDQLEIPVDSYVAIELLTKNNKKKSDWVRIKNLKEEDNLKYQKWAEEVAIARNIPRIHLDLEYWS